MALERTFAALLCWSLVGLVPAREVSGMLLEIDGAGRAFVYATEPMSVGATLAVQRQVGEVSRCCVSATVVQRLGPTAVVSDELGGGVVDMYRVVMSAPSRAPFVGIAVDGTYGRLKSLGPSLLAVDLDRRRRRLRLETCLGQEGVHLIQSERGTVVVHLYRGFDYSVSPTCRIGSNGEVLGAAASAAPGGWGAKGSRP